MEFIVGEFQTVRERVPLILISIAITVDDCQIVGCRYRG